MLYCSSQMLSSFVLLSCPLVGAFDLLIHLASNIIAQSLLGSQDLVYF